MRILLASLFLAAACASDHADDPTGEPNVIDGDANFVLYVSNQSFDIDPVDIRLWIDDRLAIDGEFLVEGQHSWHRYDLHLDPGLHLFHAESDAAGVELTETVKMRPYGILSFWYYPSDTTYPTPTPPQLSLLLQDVEPLFD